MQLPTITISLPDWLSSVPDWYGRYRTDEEKIGLAIELSRENVTHGTGGPFGAAIFNSGSGALEAVGVNLVVPNRNSTLHAEMVAIQLAEARLGVYSLAGNGHSHHVLAVSCEPCAMCLGATLWSGVDRLVCAATKEDAERVGFDEGPVFPASYEYMAARGIEVVHGIRRDEARHILDLYARTKGVIY